MNRLIVFLLFIVLSIFTFTSCTTMTSPTRNYSYPFSGTVHEIPAIPIKDFEVRGIVFVRSTKIIDSNGNRTGSKITYEMLLLEAQKLGADDIINIRLDVNRVEEVFRENNGRRSTRTTYNYTASALAIKYTTAILSTSAANSPQNIQASNHGIRISANEETSSPKRRPGRVVLLIGSIVGGLALLMAATSS